MWVTGKAKSHGAKENCLINQSVSFCMNSFTVIHRMIVIFARGGYKKTDLSLREEEMDGEAFGVGVKDHLTSAGLLIFSSTAN